MHDDVVTGRSEFLLFKDILELKMNVYIYIYIFLGGSKFLQKAVYMFTALVLPLSTFIVDEVFSLFAASYIYIYMNFDLSCKALLTVHAIHSHYCLWVSGKTVNFSCL